MSILGIRLPVTANNGSLLQFPTSKVSALNDIFAFAVDHWEFGGGAASLAGMRGEVTLTPAGSAPTYASSYLTVSGQNGLDMGLPDRLTHTFACVFKVPENLTSGTDHVLFGNWREDSYGTDGTGGCRLRLQGSSGELMWGNATANIPLRTSGRPGSPGEWIFCSGSEDYSGSNRSMRIVVGNGSGLSVFDDTDDAYNQSEPKTLADRNLQIGNTFVTSGDGGAVTMSAAAYWQDRVLTESELMQVYNHYKLRSAERGINVL